MSLDNIGAQTLQQMMSSFQSSAKEQEKMMKENKDKIKKYGMEVPKNYVKSSAKNVSKKIGRENVDDVRLLADENDKVKQTIDKTTDQVKKKAKEKAIDVAGDTLAPATGGISKVATTGINTVNKTNLIKKPKIDAISKTAMDPISSANSFTKKNEEKEKENPDKSSAIISSTKGAASKVINMDR